MLHALLLVSNIHLTGSDGMYTSAFSTMQDINFIGNVSTSLSTLTSMRSTIPTNHVSEANSTTKGNGNIYQSKKCDINPTLLNKVSLGCLMVFIPVTVLGNALVCVVVLASKNLLKQSMYKFMTSLAVADLLVGIVTMPIKAKIQWNDGCFRLPFFICWIYILGEITFSISSTLHLFILAFDKYFCLKFTFKYTSIMTTNTNICILLSTWFFALLWSFLSIFQWEKPYNISIIRKINGCSIINRNYFITVYTLWYIIPIFFMVFIYSFIYKIAVHHINEISKLQVLDSPSRKEKQRKKKELKTFRSIVIVFMAYTICWMPMVIFVLLAYGMPWILMAYGRKQWFKAIAFIFINFLPHFNSTLNPFIYVIFNKEFLTALHTLFNKITGINLGKKDNNKGINLFDKLSADAVGGNTELTSVRVTPMLKRVEQSNMNSITATNI